MNHAIAPAEFIEMWQSLSQEVQPAEPELNYRALVERIKRGEIALYLGSDIPELFDATVKNERQIVSDLAQKAAYEDFNGSLSMMAEYYRMKPEYGQPSLVRNLRDVLPQGTTEVPLYDLLAKVEQPLVLISAAYDTLMERVFLRAGKKFVLVTSLIGMNPEAEVGKVRFQYSDREGAEEPCLEDQLSHLDVLGNGYSLIYKIRGYLGDQEENMRQQQHGLTLTEEDHFTFARYMDRLIPNYVVRQLQSRGFVFLGYAPKKWEDRLIANALLYKRRQVEEPAYAVQHELDRFEEIYWDRHNVRRHVIELGAFVRKLEENFA